jgi:hypothetical protein
MGWLKRDDVISSLTEHRERLSHIAYKLLQMTQECHPEERRHMVLSYHKTLQELDYACFILRDVCLEMNELAPKILEFCDELSFEVRNPNDNPVSPRYPHA